MLGCRVQACQHKLVGRARVGKRTMWLTKLVARSFFAACKYLELLSSDSEGQAGKALLDVQPVVGAEWAGILVHNWCRL
jgi:hypothetical protein